MSLELGKPHTGLGKNDKKCKYFDTCMFYGSGPLRSYHAAYMNQNYFTFCLKIKCIFLFFLNNLVQKINLIYAVFKTQIGYYN
jgi:hypothetical protein